MLNTRAIYKSVLHHARQIAPSGVAVIEGESYGVRVADPRIVAPSITVTFYDNESSAVELGSDSLEFQVVYTLTGKSHIQRDALKDAVYNGLTSVPIRLYTDFTGEEPSEGAMLYRTAQLGDYIKITDTPRFDTENELLFWVAVVYTQLLVV